MIDDWYMEAKRLWSIRIGLFWGAVQGLLLIWTALVDVLPLWVYVTVGVIANMSIVGARLLKQPGADE